MYTVLHLGFCPGYTIIMGGGGSWGPPPAYFLDFEHPEIIPGAFLDQNFSNCTINNNVSSIKPRIEFKEMFYRL